MYKKFNIVNNLNLFIRVFFVKIILFFLLIDFIFLKILLLFFFIFFIVFLGKFCIVILNLLLMFNYKC